MKNLNKIRGKREFHFDDKELIALGICSTLLIFLVLWLGILIGKGNQAQEMTKLEENPPITLSPSSSLDNPSSTQQAQGKLKEEESKHASSSQPGEPKRDLKLSYYTVLQDAEQPKDQSIKQSEASPGMSVVKSDSKELNSGQTTEDSKKEEVSKEGSGTEAGLEPRRTDNLPEVPSKKPEGPVKNNFESESAIYTVQVASSQNREESELLRNQLREKGYDATLISVNLGPQGIWYRVRVGNLKDRMEAERLKKELQERFSVLARNPLIVKGSEQ
ncbi:MAG TPA: SPOR domain-containing protein [Candidatus Limnocylindrales bacterium]|nr:SPOR domain-containing protein [Candidatus Limnocylindrales bacterium]